MYCNYAYWLWFILDEMQKRKEVLNLWSIRKLHGLCMGEGAFWNIHINLTVFERFHLERGNFELTPLRIPYFQIEKFGWSYFYALWNNLPGEIGFQKDEYLAHSVFG